MFSKQIYTLWICVISLMNQQFVIPDNSPNWNSSITTQLRYKHAFYQNLVSTNKLLSLYSRKNMTCLNVGLLRICQVFFFLSPVKLCVGVSRQIAVSWAMLSVFNKLTRIQSSETQRLTESPAELHIYICLTDLICTNDRWRVRYGGTQMRPPSVNRRQTLRLLVKR